MENKDLKAHFLDHSIQNRVVFYTISILNSKKNQTYFLISRYSSLLNFHNRLKEKFGDNFTIAIFPPKKWFGNLNSDFIQRRKAALEQYLNNILKQNQLIEDPITREFFELSEQIYKNSNSGAYKMFDEKKLEKKFSEKSRSILGELTRQKSVSQSFSVNDFDPSFALVDLERLKKGEIHLQDFLTTYNLILLEDNLDWEIISTNKFEHDRKQDIKFINYHVFDNSKEKNYSVQMIEFKKENDHSIIHYIKELFILKYLSTKIDNRNIIFVKTCLYFEKVDRFHREIKRNLLITTECSLLILKESVLLRKMRQNPWTNQELLSIFKSLLFLFSELEKLGFSHNCLNLNNIFYSKSEEIYKVGNFVCSWHKSQGEFETEELEHMKTNRKYNSPTINEFIDKTLTKDYPKTMNINLHKNDIFALGIIFYEMFKIQIFETQEELLEELEKDCSKEIQNDGFYIIKLIKRMLDFDEEKRAGFSELLDDFINLRKISELLRTDKKFREDVDKFLPELHPEWNTFKDKVKKLTLMAHGYNKLKNYNKALETYDKILELSKTSSELTSEEKIMKEIKFLRKKSLIYYDNLDYATANKFLMIAFSLCEEYSDFSHYSSILLALAQNKLANYEFKQANDYLEKVLELYRTEFGEESIKIADIYSDLGCISNKMDNFELAKSYLEKSIHIHQLTKEPENIAYGRNYLNLGETYLGMNEIEKALESLEKAEEIFFNLTGTMSYNIALVKNKIGEVYLQKKEYEKSLSILEEAWALTKQFTGASSLSVSDVHLNLGKCHGEMKNFEKALDFLKNSLQIRKTNFGKIHFEVADVQDALGCMYLKKGDFDSANKEFHFALKTFKRILGKSHLRIADLYNNYGFIHTKLQNLQKAKKCHERCLNIYKVNLGENHKNVSITLNNLGSICLETGEYEEAIMHFQEAIDVLINNQDENITLAGIYNLMGITYCNMGQNQEALNALQNSYKIYSTKLDKNSSQMIKLTKDILKLKESISDY